MKWYDKKWNWRYAGRNYTRSKTWTSSSRTNINLASGGDIGDEDGEDFLPLDDDDEPVPLMRKASRAL